MPKKFDIHDEFPSGIPYYTTGEVNIKVHFPGDRVSCNYCELFCTYNEHYKRYKCRVTDETLLYPFDTVGFKCPLIIYKENENENL